MKTSRYSSVTFWETILGLFFRHNLLGDLLDTERIIFKEKGHLHLAVSKKHVHQQARTLGKNSFNVKEILKNIMEPIRMCLKPHFLDKMGGRNAN